MTYNVNQNAKVVGTEGPKIEAEGHEWGWAASRGGWSGEEPRPQTLRHEKAVKMHVAGIHFVSYTAQIYNALHRQGKAKVKKR